MKKLLTIILTVFLLFSSTLSIHYVQADETDETESEITEVSPETDQEEGESTEVIEPETEITEEGEDESEPVEEAETILEEPEIELNGNVVGFTSVIQDATTGNIRATYSAGIPSVNKLYITDDRNSMWDCYAASEIQEGYTLSSDGSYVDIDFSFIEYIGASAGETLDLSLNFADENSSTGYTYIDGTVTLTMGCQSYPSDLTVVEDADGNIVVSSSDTDYIEALVSPRAYNNKDHLGMNYESKVIIRNSSPYYSHQFYNTVWYMSEDDTRYENNVSVSSDGESLIISNAKILETYLPNSSAGQDATYELWANGYTHKTGTIHITKGVKTVSDYDISVDDDNNLVISSSDEDWLETMLTTNYAVALKQDYSTVAYFSNTSGYTDLVFTQATSEEDAYITISASLFSANKVEDGTYYLYLKADGYFGTETSNTLVLSGYVEEAPDDIEIYQDEDTYNIIITSEDADYLEAVCENYSDRFYYYSGLKFSIQLEGGLYDEEHFYNYIDEDDEQIIGLQLMEEEGDTWIEIDGYLVSTCFSNSGEMHVSLYAPGYSRFDADFDYVAHLKALPSGLTVSVDSARNVVISGLNEEFAEAWDDYYSYIVVYQNGNEIMEEISSRSTSIDEETLDLYIPNRLLNNIMNFSYGQYSFEFYVSGYEVGSVSLNYIDTRKNVPSDLRVSQDSSGNLKITTSDKKYLNNLVKSYDMTQSDQYYSYVSNGDTDIYNLEYRYSADESYQYTFMTLKNTTVTISNTVLKAWGWMNGSTEITVACDGYKDKEVTLTLRNLCVDSKPEDSAFTCNYVEGTGIVITCTDSDFLNGLMIVNDENWCGSYIYFINVTEDHEFTLYNYKSSRKNNQQYYNYYLNNGQLIIPEIVLGNFGVYEGTYGIVLRSCGYTEQQYLSVELPYLYEEVPQDVSIDRDIDGNIVISSSDSDYLDAITTLWNYNVTTAGGYVGGEIQIGDAWLYNCNDPDNLADDLQTENGNVVISAESLRRDIGVSGTYDFYIYTTFYEYYEDSIELTFITTEADLDDVHAGDVIELSYEDENITWSVSDEEIATIDETGELHVFKQGTVEVNANNGFTGDTVVIEVKPYVPSGAITAVVEYADNLGFIPGDEAMIFVYDNGEEVDSRIFDFKSKSTKIATVTDNILTAVAKGSTSVDIYYKGTKTKVASVKLTVIPVQVETIFVSAYDYMEEGDSIYLEKDTKTVQLTTICQDKYSNVLSKAGYKYTSSDTSIATVDSKGKVTIKKAGQFTITVTTTGNDKSKGQKSDSIVFKVMDYTPVLESNKVTVNRYYTLGTDIEVYAKYSNDVNHSSAITDAYFAAGRPFTASYEDGQINIRYTGSDTKNKTYNETLYIEVETSDEQNFTYSYSLKLTTVTKLPTIKQTTSGVYNTFTNENTLKLNMEIEGGLVPTSGEIPGNWIGVESNGDVSLTATDTKGNVVTKGKIMLSFPNYTQPVTLNIAFKTVSTAPKYKLDTTSVSIYAPKNAESVNNDVTLHLLNGSDVITEGTWTLDNAPAGTTITMNEDGDIILHVGNTTKSHTLKLNYRKDSWATGKKLTYSVKVNIVSSSPTAKLSASSLTLNTYFNRENSTAITSSCLTNPITGIESQFKASKGQSDPGIEFELINGKIYASIDSGDVPNGSYKYTITPKITVNEAEVRLKPVTLTIKVESTIPTLTLKSASAKFNIGLTDGEDPVTEEITTTYSLKNNPYDIQIKGMKEYVKVGKQYIEITEDNMATYGLVDILFEDGVAIICGLNSKATKVDYYIAPVYTDYDGEVVPIPEKQYTKYTATFYNAAPKASISIKGNLNQLNLTAEAVGTVKYTNLLDTVAFAQIENYSTAFNAENYISAEVRDGKIYFTLTSAAQAAKLKDGTYKFNVKLTSEFGVETTSTVSIKLARKAPTLKLASSTVNVYDMTSIDEEVARVKLNKTGNGTIEAISVSGSSAYELSLSSDNEYIVVTLKDAAAIKAGSTSKFTIKIDWTGDYGTTAEKTKSLKTTSLTLNVKDCSSNVKGNMVMVQY